MLVVTLSSLIAITTWISPAMGCLSAVELEVFQSRCCFTARRVLEDPPRDDHVGRPDDHEPVPVQVPGELQGYEQQQQEVQSTLALANEWRRAHVKLLQGF